MKPSEDGLRYCVASAVKISVMQQHIRYHKMLGVQTGHFTIGVRKLCTDSPSTYHSSLLDVYLVAFVSYTSAL